eukprot:1036578-Pelagomonas_calceolata.AAC.1
MHQKLEAGFAPGALRYASHSLEPSPASKHQGWNPTWKRRECERRMSATHRRRPAFRQEGEAHAWSGGRQPASLCSQ